MPIFGFPPDEFDYTLYDESATDEGIYTEVRAIALISAAAGSDMPLEFVDDYFEGWMYPVSCNEIIRDNDPNTVDAIEAWIAILDYAKKKYDGRTWRLYRDDYGLFMVTPKEATG